MRINFSSSKNRTMAQAVIRRRLIAKVILGRSKWDTRMWWTKWHYDTHFFPEYFVVSPVSITPPMSVLSSPWYYSLSGEAQDFKNCTKLFSFVSFIYPRSPVTTICIIAFYIKKPYILQQNTVLRFVWLAQKSISLYTMCAACLLRGANWICTYSAN
jgi:hypothetical protein